MIELKERIRIHGLWLRSEEGGKRFVAAWQEDFTRANLTDADLTDADLTRANLTDADLTGADLTGANLTGADLTGANLTGAYLTGANLTGADLTRADLAGADLTRADLAGADLTDANLTDADLTGVPIVENLAARVLAIAEKTPELFDMSGWHKAPKNCGTPHCAAGWAIDMGEKAGYALEQRLGPSAAGALIWAKSEGEIPPFYGSDEDALEKIRGIAQRSAERKAQAEAP